MEAQIFPKSQAIFAAITLFLILPIQIHSNLIQRGSFDDYTIDSLGTTSTGGALYFGYPTNDPTEWFNALNSKF